MNANVVSISIAQDSKEPEYVNRLSADTSLYVCMCKIALKRKR